jgi:hypothetical protein
MVLRLTDEQLKGIEKNLEWLIKESKIMPLDRDKYSGWDILANEDKIAELKAILQDKYIVI